MIIVMALDATPEEIEKVEDTIRKLGYTPHAIVGVERKVIGAVGDERGKDRLQSIETMGGVRSEARRVGKECRSRGSPEP